MKRHLLVLLALAAVFTGCEKRREVETETFEEDERKYVMSILLDLSGSFSYQMADEGQAYMFAMQVLDKYFRNRVGSQDEIILAQISGGKRALLWQGTPQELRETFPSADDFREFLYSKMDPNGSRVHDAIAQTVEYAMSDPAVASGQAKSAVFVLSDLLDTTVEAEESKKRAVDALAKYGQQGHSVGLYYIDQLLLPEWRRHLQDAGIDKDKYCAECEIIGTPRLPTLEE